MKQYRGNVVKPSYQRCACYLPTMRLDRGNRIVHNTIDATLKTELKINN